MARDSIATLPNVVSMSRLLMAALFPFLRMPEARLALIAGAAATDMLDGYLARRGGSITRFGTLIDPAADRGFLLVAVAVLWWDGTLSPLGTLVLVSRDLIVLGAFAASRGSMRLRRFGFAARPAGKVVTVLQLATLAVAFLRPSWTAALVAIVAVMTVVAVGDYAVVFFRARRTTVIIAAIAAAGVASSPAAAQGYRLTPQVQMEAGAGVVASRTSVALLALGANEPAGDYVRLAESVAAGREMDTGGMSVVRVEAVARFLTDPYGLSRWGPYAGGGTALEWRAGERGRAALLLVAGTDLPDHGAWRPAIEVAVGAGLRASVVLRRARQRGR